MAKVLIMDHPLVQHKISFIRRTDTGTKDFRQTIGEIAMETGFSNQFHFSKVFHKECGISPSQYRKSRTVL